ncbi:hypothetical protein IFM89_022419 [Coptis chinensis]|uniref:Uncharacterized protein n=1 Tax=Coptis chinensis TaxID=261450 RepID=A0A835I2H6_9MAGN|nr:hypothetical protein IFM89_022419 [Coptis chinensis]
MQRLGVTVEYKSREPTPCIWKKPETDTTKLNAYGSLTDISCSNGGIIRDANGFKEKLGQKLWGEKEEEIIVFIDFHALRQVYPRA